MSTSLSISKKDFDVFHKSITKNVAPEPVAEPVKKTITLKDLYLGGNRHQRRKAIALIKKFSK